jgi:RNA polymerase sigma-B factor
LRRLRTLEPGSGECARQRAAIIQRCLPLADHIARRFHDRGEPHEDLVQVARVGLVNAMNRFDVDNYTDFLAFAVPTMMGEVRRYFRDYGWSVKVPRRLKDLHVQCNAARHELTHQMGRAPRASEVAEYLGVDQETVLEVMIAGNGYWTNSIDAPAATSEGQAPMNERFGEEDSSFEKILDAQCIRPLLLRLSKRERTILRMRFFGEMTQSEIGAAMGLSQMHISRLLAGALATLRAAALDAEAV